MKKLSRLIRVSILAAGLLAADTGLAQETQGQSSGDWAPVKHLEFTDEDIEGGIYEPDGTRIESVVPSEHTSLIELRRGFEAEIVKMLEDI